jgi:hypothetical protein
VSLGSACSGQDLNPETSESAAGTVTTTLRFSVTHSDSRKVDLSEMNDDIAQSPSPQQVYFNISKASRK